MLTVPSCSCCSSSLLTRCWGPWWRSCRINTLPVAERRPSMSHAGSCALWPECLSFSVWRWRLPRRKSMCNHAYENRKGGVKMTSERWQHHNVIFTQRLVGLLVKSVDFSNLCCIMCQWWPFKNGETALFKFFLYISSIYIYI